MFFTDFIYRLRDAGVPVSLTDTMDFYRGLEKGLAPDLESLFVFARLSFVRRVEELDAFERAFAFHFYAIELPPVAEGDPELFYTQQFRDWLRKSVEEGELPPEAIWSMSPEELMERFWQRLREQMEEHHGGSKWVGTGGTSPFGHSGNARGGARVLGASKKRSALKVIGERRYVSYSSRTSLRAENLRQALATLKNMVPAGPRDVLDVEATVDESARNGGEIELVFDRDHTDRIEVVLLVDNGGFSMDPHVELTRLLFAKIEQRFRRARTFFFHNTVYGCVWSDPPRLKPLATADLLRLTRETRLIVLGDAAMAPQELTHPYGAIDYRIALMGDGEPSLTWLQRLRDRFPHAVWLNPLPKEIWPEAHGHLTIHRIGQVIPMEDLTLGGIKRGVELLNRG